MSLKETKPSHIKLLYQMLYDTHRIFELFDLPYSMIGGTLLGAVRHGGIIPWDDDGDLGIGYKDEKKFLSLRKYFKKCGYSVVSTFFGYKIFYTIRKKITGCNYSFPFIDIFIYKNIKGFFKPAYKEVRDIWPKDMFRLPMELERHKFGRFWMWGPKMDITEEYLATGYGNDYMDVAYRQYDHAKEEEVESVKVKLTDEMRKPAQPIDKVKNTFCISKISREICEKFYTANFIE